MAQAQPETPDVPAVRKGQTGTALEKDEFAKRFDAGYGRLIYPCCLTGWPFGVFVHGEAAGAEMLCRSLSDWLPDMHRMQARHAAVDWYIGSLGDYAHSRDALDADTAVQEELRDVAREVVATVRMMGAGRYEQPGCGLSDPRPK